MTGRNTAIFLFVATMSAAGCTTMQSRIQQTGQMAQVDRDYVNMENRLASLDDQEGALAKTKATDPRVAATATQVMSQADTLHPRLQAALQAEGAAPPATPQVSAEVARLRGLNGNAFDRQYVADELNMHQQAADVFKKEEDETKDDALRTQVQAELPAVQENRDKFKVLADDMAKSQDH
ncbi:MAG: DUF4142 domain-containing protein [Acetobacteraceae bacterium]|nr:DUF4142 domain-containing protein [Acetobacteraceae bacterium]